MSPSHRPDQSGHVYNDAPINDASELTDLAILPAAEPHRARDAEQGISARPEKDALVGGQDEKGAIRTGNDTPGSDKERDGLRSPSEGEDERLAIRAIPRRYQLLAFSMIIFFNTSSSFSESTLSPLKGVFRDNLGVTSTCHLLAGALATTRASC